MTLRERILTGLAILAVVALLALNPNQAKAGELELSASWDHYEMDEYFSTEEKGVPGFAVGVNQGLWTGRLSYNHGDLWVGNTNRDFRSLRFDIERDFTEGFLVPYAVIGAAHTEQDWDYSNEGETSFMGSVGLGLKMNFGKHFTLSADARSVMDDILHQDGLMYAARLTMKLGGSDKPLQKMVTEPETLPSWETSVHKIIFDNDSATLTDAHKQLIRTLVMRSNVADIEIEGHASSPASDHYNQMLSEKRVNNVANYIHSLDANAIMDVDAYGEMYATDDHNASRNVTITVTTIEH